MIHKLILFVFLVLFWFALSNQQGQFFVVAGLASCGFAFALALHIGVHKKMVHNANIFKYIAWLLKEVAISGVVVTKAVWAKNLKLQPEFVTVETANKSDVFLAMYANSITMTPGTVTVLIKEHEGIIIAHALDKNAEDDLKGGKMQRKINEVLS